jgi:hypothetical protein
MNENAETKICPFCAETIKAAAKKCPFCNSRLPRFAVFRQELFMCLCGVIMFGYLIAVVALTWPSDSDGSRYNFAWHRGDLEAKSVNVVVTLQGTNEYYYEVSGFVTNKGNIPWRVEEIELSVTNSQETPDIVHATIKNGFVVQSHTEHAFVLHERTSMTNAVVAAKARVENARDGNAPGKFD